jgi:hypothetical protein
MLIQLHDQENTVSKPHQCSKDVGTDPAIKRTPCNWHPTAKLCTNFAGALSIQEIPIGIITEVKPFFKILDLVLLAAQ